MKKPHQKAHSLKRIWYFRHEAGSYSQYDYGQAGCLGGRGVEVTLKLTTHQLWGTLQRKFHKLLFWSYLALLNHCLQRLASGSAHTHQTYIAKVCGAIRLRSTAGLSGKWFYCCVNKFCFSFCIVSTKSLRSLPRRRWVQVRLDFCSHIFHGLTLGSGCIY